MSVFRVSHLLIISRESQLKMFSLGIILHVISSKASSFALLFYIQEKKCKKEEKTFLCWGCCVSRECVHTYELLLPSLGKCFFMFLLVREKFLFSHSCEFSFLLLDMAFKREKKFLFMRLITMVWMLFTTWEMKTLDLNIFNSLRSWHCGWWTWTISRILNLFYK